MNNCILGGMFMKQAYNPFLPLDTYIADGEPHVFGDRVYLFGSHDKEAGDTYCMLDYVFWSAPVGDLGSWSCKGVSYSARQDPLYGDKLKYMYAPDVVQGNDGKFYLYYCMSGDRGKGGYGQPVSVAVCDTPDGRYDYLGFVRNPDGSPMLKYVTFDPAVINDSGVIRLYYGTWYPFCGYGKILDNVFRKVESRIFDKTPEEIRQYQDGVMGANHVELAEDMLTIKSEPVHIMPPGVKGSAFEKHPFFEASSIRKIGSTYYFIYSSTLGHELCYAVSQYPDRGFAYGGTIVSNGDVSYQGRRAKDRLNATGTNHGSIEFINGGWYVFYHRNTNKSAYSRQACAEPVRIMEDGRIAQVEITSQGLNGRPLEARGSYPAAICCNLTNGRMPHQGNGRIRREIPCIAFENGERIVTAVVNTQIVYKYFKFTDDIIGLRLRCRGKGCGTLYVYVEAPSSDISAFGKAAFSVLCGSVKAVMAEQWHEVSCACDFPAGIGALVLVYRGNGVVKLLDFSFICHADGYSAVPI